MIIAILVLCPELLFSELKQFIYNPIVLLDYRVILESLSIAEDSFTIQISTYFICKAFKSVFGKSIISVFCESDLYPKMLFLECIKINQTQYFQLNSIYENEDTIDSIYTVHDNIFKKQLAYL